MFNDKKSPVWARQKDSEVWAGSIRHDNLEVMQWVALIAMVLDHISFFMPSFGQDEIYWMSFIGRIAMPLSMLVFSWRIAHITWSDPEHNFMPMFFRLILCALVSHVGFILTGRQDEMMINVVTNFLCISVVIWLMQEDRGWKIPIGARVVASSMIGLWVTNEVDYGVAGLFLGLGIYSFIRYSDSFGKNVALISLGVISFAYPIHAAFLSIPLAWVIHTARWETKRPVTSLFYFLYPAHVFLIAFAINIQPDFGHKNNI